MTSSYRDPRVSVPMSYPTEEEIQRKTQAQPSLLDIVGGTALGLGAAALAGVGIARGLRRNAVRPIVTQNLNANAEETVRRAARSTATPPPSRPAPPAGVARQQAAEEFTRQARAERPGALLPFVVIILFLSLSCCHCSPSYIYSALLYISGHAP